MEKNALQEGNIGRAPSGIMVLYRPLSLLAAATFALVGLILLLLPEEVLTFFNQASLSLGMPQMPVQAGGYYLILAVGYMCVVTLLAWLMYRNPSNRTFPLLLAQAKLATAALSLLFFLTDQQYLLYLGNLVVDGLIGLVALVFYVKLAHVAA